MIDGAGPFRILRSIIVPQSIAGDHRGQPVPLLLRLERLLRAAAVPRQQARPAAAVDRDPAVQRAVRDPADADPGVRAHDDGRAGRRSSCSPSGRSCAASSSPASTSRLGPPAAGTEPGPRHPDEGDLGCATATSTTSGGNTSSPARTRRCRGSTTSGSEDYFALVSNTAGGYSFYRDARLRRLIRYRYNNAPLDVGGRFLYVRDDDTGDYWNPGWQPTQRELDDYACRHGLGYTVITGERGGIRAETTYLVPPGRDARGLADARDQRPAGARRGCRCSAPSSSASGTPRTTPRTSSATCPPARSTSRTASIYHLTEYRERRDHFAWFACSAPVAGLRDVARGRSSGPYRGWDRPVAVERGAMTGSDRPRLAAGRGAPGDAGARTGRVARRDVRARATPRTRPDAQVRPARLRPAGHDAGSGGDRPLPAARDRSTTTSPPCGRPGTERLGDAPGDHRRPARRPDGQHLEPLPVHGDVQPVALGVHVRVGHRAGHGVPGLQPGPARLRPHGPGARPGAHPRHRRHPAARRRRLPPVPAAHEARQPRHRLRVQRRPRVARARRRGLPQGDRRPRDPRRARALGQRGGLGDAAPRPPAAVHRLHPRPARAARAAAHRAGRLERLPQPQRLLGPARRVLPDGPQPARRRRRVGVHRRPLRARRARGGGDRPAARRRGRGRPLPARRPRR